MKSVQNTLSPRVEESNSDSASSCEVKSPPSIRKSQQQRSLSTAIYGHAITSSFTKQTSLRRFPKHVTFVLTSSSRPVPCARSAGTGTSSDTQSKHALTGLCLRRQHMFAVNSRGPELEPKSATFANKHVFVGEF